MRKLSFRIQSNILNRKILDTYSYNGKVGTLLDTRGAYAQIQYLDDGTIETISWSDKDKLIPVTLKYEIIED